MAYGLEPGASSSSSGFTLVEVIAALLVVGIGLIGVAALYGEAMQTEIDTHPQAQAARLAQVMTGKIESNATGRTGYANVIGVLCTETRDPRPVNAAAQEAACWHDEIRKALPNGTGSIARDLSTNPPTYVVAVSWSAAGAGAASYVVRVQPTK
jgi:type IV pilus assembly protein PilV